MAHLPDQPVQLFVNPALQARPACLEVRPVSTANLVTTHRLVIRVVRVASLVFIVRLRHQQTALHVVLVNMLLRRHQRFVCHVQMVRIKDRLASRVVRVVLQASLVPPKAQLIVLPVLLANLTRMLHRQTAKIALEQGTRLQQDRRNALCVLLDLLILLVDKQVVQYAPQVKPQATRAFTVIKLLLDTIFIMHPMAILLHLRVQTTQYVKVVIVSLSHNLDIGLIDRRAST
mmetsp:Transcript_33412/g.39238  ORF Transcript_33412/g.39238 Transcript_33412/m.39238 type:complete len:231 (+) Transcript_33412:1508-2200(+)